MLTVHSSSWTVIDLMLTCGFASLLNNVDTLFPFEPKVGLHVKWEWGAGSRRNANILFDSQYTPTRIALKLQVRVRQPKRIYSLEAAQCFRLDAVVDGDWCIYT
jgi:hypothetical protein